MTAAQKPCEERIKELWQDQLRAVDYELWPGDLFLAIMCTEVSDIIRMLIQGNVYKAQFKIWHTENLLLRSRAANEDPEILYQSLHILDIAHFAWALGAYSRFYWSLVGNVRCFCDVVELAEEIWHAREDFAPYLSNALRATFIFLREHKYTGVRRAFRYALKYSYEFSGRPPLHKNKPIGHLLSAVAINRLKKILRAYLQKWSSGGGGRE